MSARLAAGGFWVLAFGVLLTLPGWSGEEAAAPLPGNPLAKLLSAPGAETGRYEGRTFVCGTKRRWEVLGARLQTGLASSFPVRPKCN